jgi:beta-N-acetylhexosaminidase
MGGHPMIKNKQLIGVFICVVVLMLLLTACGINTDTSSDENGRQSTGAPVASFSPTAAPAPPQTSLPSATAKPTEAPDFAENLLKTMTLEEKIGQLFIYGLQNEGVEFTEGMARTMTQFQPAGVVLFSEKIGTRAQVIALTEALQSHSDLPLFIAVDEEGGRVSRIGSLFDDAIGPAGKTQSADEAAARGAEIGRRLRELGFNLNFAPVADVNSNPQNTVIGDRAFSSDPDTAAAYVAAFIEGSQRENVLTVIKHFPGHGDTDEDSHQGIAVFRHDRQRLNEIELKPFVAGIAAGTDAVMIGHISAPEITGDDLPATFSAVMITEILRGALGFDGLVITDAMNMGAITNRYSAGEAAVAALKAGADVILMPEDLAEAYHAVTAACGSGALTEERINASVLRVLRVKEKIAAE